MPWVFSTKEKGKGRNAGRNHVRLLMMRNPEMSTEAQNLLLAAYGSELIVWSELNPSWNNEDIKARRTLNGNYQRRHACVAALVILQRPTLCKYTTCSWVPEHPHQPPNSGNMGKGLPFLANPSVKWGIVCTNAISVKKKKKSLEDKVKKFT